MAHIQLHFDKRGLRDIRLVSKSREEEEDLFLLYQRLRADINLLISKIRVIGKDTELLEVGGDIRGVVY